MILWGDLHNHCGITYGFGSLENALKIAKSHLDFCCITGHAMWPDIYKRSKETEFIVDFHLQGFKKLNDHWQEIQEKIAQANTNDFITFQSYEMHSSLHGDHHIISCNDHLPLIYKKSPKQLVKDCGVPAIAVPHHIGYTPGYRGINWDLFDETISPCVEVVSKHGCGMSEQALYPYYHDMGPRDSHNTVYEGMKRKKRFSFLGSTDHHAGFPGSYGDGLTAVMVKEKSREAIWQALLSGRTYAVTGDKILCDFTLNGHTLGEQVVSKKRNLQCTVVGEYFADKLVVYKNCKPLAFICGEQLKPTLTKRYKLRVEMGWGNSEDLTRWSGQIETQAKICGVNLYIRGRSLLSPTNHDGTVTQVNDIDNKIIKQEEHFVAFQCETVRNKSTLHPQTDAVVIELEGELSTKISVTVNQRTYTDTIENLLQFGTSWHVEPYHSQAVKVHTLVPSWAYEMQLEVEDDEGSETEVDIYHAEFTQKNGQCAYISPIYATNN